VSLLLRDDSDAVSDADAVDVVDAVDGDAVGEGVNSLSLCTTTVSRMSPADIVR
jgi:hypothetical protein